jgi:hypothetical protein
MVEDDDPSLGVCPDCFARLCGLASSITKS